MQSSIQSLVSLVALTSCLGLPACSDPATPNSPEPPPVKPDPPPSFTPKFAEVPCPTPLPAGLIEGQNVRCGELEVLQKRLMTDGQTLVLHVMIVRGTDNPKPDPIVHLIGGPGGAIQSYEEVLGGDFGLGLSAKTQRDLILFDQRGTGRSAPLKCTGNTLNASCVNKLMAEGIDIAAYNTEESAADVEDLRTALGYSSINLYGQSYGTLLGQTVLRLFPKGIRSAMLESTSAVAHDAFFTNSPKAFELALGRVIAECAADAACNAAFPDPAGDLQNILNTYAQNGTSPTPLLQLMQLDLQFAEGTSHLPLLLRAIAAGDQATADATTQVIAAKESYFAEAIKGFNPVMFTVMNCYDYLPLLTPEQNEKINASTSPAFREAFGEDPAAAVAACAALPKSSVSSEQQLPVSSDIPTLLIAGTHDSNTPLEIAVKTKATLSKGHLVEMPGWGHILLAFGNACAMDVYAAFLEDPSKAPGSECLAGMKTKFAMKGP